MRIHHVMTILAVLLLGSCNTSKYADEIYINGDFITMAKQGHRATSLAVKDGKILALGDYDDMIQFQSSTTEVVDLLDRTVLPGFIDAHSHISIGAEVVNHANLSSPPVADINNIGDILTALKVNQDMNQIDSGEWIVGWGYDPDLLDEGRHPIKADLDASFPNNPVFLRHVSGHLGVLNSVALDRLGFTAETSDPEGGKIYRFQGSSEPNGLVAESVMHIVLESLPIPSKELQKEQLDKTFDLYLRNGFTTANDGYSTPTYIKMLRDQSQLAPFPIDVIALVGFKDMQDQLSDPDFKWRQYHNGLKFAGVKMITDGSPQGKTAKMRDPYLTAVPGCAHDCTGISLINQEQTDQLVDLLYSQGIQVFSHCNGDGAIDMFLNAHDQAIRTHQLMSSELRTVIIHSQFMREDLVEQYASHQLIPSYFTNHTYFWGDVHLNNMGQERAFYISPISDTDDAGITYTNHSDYPITPLDPMMQIHSAVNRVSRSGIVIGPDQRATVYEALKAMTINAAYQYFEEDIKGSLEVGKWADMVVLSDDPMNVEVANLKDITILQTIKKGKTVYLKN